VSRRRSVAANFSRTFVDGVLEHSRADYVRRPRGVVVRRAPASVRIEVVDALEVEDRHSWASP
jgi:hypothetical protein